MSASVSTILASASPARLRLLRSAGIEPQVRVADVDEESLAASLGTDSTARVVQALAAAKAEAVVMTLPAVATATLVVAADSLFEVDGLVLGKPGSQEAARHRLAGLAGRCGDLLTGHTAVLLTPAAPPRRAGGVAATRVCFEEFTAAELDAYVATGEPVDVAGGFTLDGIAAPFISEIDGDPSNVIGLSLPLLRRLAAHLGVFWPDLWAVNR